MYIHVLYMHIQMYMYIHYQRVSRLSMQGVGYDMPISLNTPTNILTFSFLGALLCFWSGLYLLVEVGYKLCDVHVVKKCPNAS